MQNILIAIAFFFSSEITIFIDENNSELKSENRTMNVNEKFDLKTNFNIYVINQNNI